MKKILLTFTFLYVGFFLFAQNNTKWHIGLQMGGDQAFGDINKKWNVRQNLNSYSGYDYDYSYNSESLLSNSSAFFMEIKTEYHLSNKLSLASGISFTKLNVSFTGNGTNGNYFFLRVSDANATQMDCFRIKSIDEENNYLGVPLELKYTPFRIGRFGFYGKIGTDIGFLIHKKTRINFQLPEMQQYENEVFESVGTKTNSLLSTLRGGLGISYTTNKDLVLNFDIFSGGSFLTENNSRLINLKSMSGVQCSIMLPLNIKK